MNKKDFTFNREKVLDLMEDNSILIEFNREVSTEDDIFKQTYNENRNFYYATGVLEFDDILVLVKYKSKKNSIMYINPYDEFKAKWVGAPLPPEEIERISGIDDVRYKEEFEDDLMSFFDTFETVYLDLADTKMDGYLSKDEKFAKDIKEKKPWLNIKNGRLLFQHARTIKSDAEIAEMRRAIHITKLGLEAVMSNMRPQYEYQFESYFDQAVKFNGATGYAFPTIAASGVNSCCLHYMENKDKAENGDLILFDLGASLNMYCSDISRTFPVSGKFTKRQKEIYNIVLKGQQLIFDNAKPGITTRELNKILVKYYAKELRRIGFIKSDEEVGDFYWHGCSHHIGLDCHDLCDYTPLKAGSIISNEPGLYIESEKIGIRIEDDILITENGAEWLSKEIIKDPDEIEKFIEEHRK